jgi:SNF2 family DNA or RNA helicase
LRLIYDAVQHRQIQNVNNAAAKGKVPHMMILQAINYMRQLCDHPALVPDARQ